MALSTDQTAILLSAARFVGLVAPTLYAGVTAQRYTISDSFTFIRPIVEHAPNQKTMAKQWLRGYQYGPLWVPPLVVPGAASNVSLAMMSEDPLSKNLYIAAAIGIFSILPITFLYMEPGINGALKWKVQTLLQDEGMKLPETSIFIPSAHEHGSTQSSRRWAERTDIRELMEFWRSINNVRWVIGGVAAALSGYATFSS